MNGTGVYDASLAINPYHYFNWHPLLMTLGFVLFYLEGALVFRAHGRDCQSHGRMCCTLLPLCLFHFVCCLNKRVERVVDSTAHGKVFRMFPKSWGKTGLMWAHGISMAVATALIAFVADAASRLEPAPLFY